MGVKTMGAVDKDLLNARTTVIAVGLLILWRLYLSATLQLHPDEAYYWLWSRNLDIGYFDHPPMVAYFIWFTTLLSKSELWVRLSGTLVSVVLSVVIWRLALQMYNNVRVAAGSVILFNVLPLTTMGLVVVTPDTPVLLFWSLGLYVFWQALHSEKTWLWYLLGVVLGLALLSKYTAVLMLPCMFLYLALSEHRRWLKTHYPYAAALIAGICFMPVVVWNSQHDWVSFTFQLKNGLNSDGYSLARVAEYIGGQMLITGPVLWVVGMWAAGVAIFYRRDRQTLLLVCAAIPVVAFFAVSSLKKAAGPNWPAFAYVGLCILVAHYCLATSPQAGGSNKRQWLWSTAVVTSLALSAVMSLHARFNVIPLDRYSQDLAVADATNYFYGWKELAEEVAKYPDNIAITPSHQLSAEIIYYTGERVVAGTAKTSRPSQFNLWSWSKDLAQQDELFVWTDRDYLGPNTDYLALLAHSDLLRIVRGGNTVRTLYLTSAERMVAQPLAAH